MERKVVETDKIGFSGDRAGSLSLVQFTLNANAYVGEFLELMAIEPFNLALLLLL